MLDYVETSFAIARIVQDEALTAIAKVPVASASLIPASPATSIAGTRDKSSRSENPSQWTAASQPSSADLANPLKAWEWAFDVLHVKSDAPVKATMPTASAAFGSFGGQAVAGWPILAPWLAAMQQAALRPALVMPMFGVPASNPFAAAFNGPSQKPMMISSPMFDPARVHQSMNDMARAFWTMPAMPWTLWHMPMATMFVSAGMPYAVAAPFARASAAALDAADAARLQAVEAFEAYSAYRSDGGHASAQIITWPYAAGANAYRRH